MTPHLGFFERAAPLPISKLAEKLGATLKDGSDGAYLIHDVKSLTDAGTQHLSFFENRKYIHELTATSAGACLVAPAFADRAPKSTCVLISPTPHRAFAKALGIFYADASVTRRSLATNPANPLIHPTAKIGHNVTIEPGAIIGQEAEIGDGTLVSSGAVVGFRVVLGNDCHIGPCASLIHTIAGDRVIVHAGVRIGQDGFGYAMGAKGHAKIPQIGRVLIGDDVEIGANTTVDRGALDDTVIGEGTKIDNLVQVAHNVKIGRHCVIVAQSGFAGSAQLGDFVVIGGCTAVKEHVKIGTGAQIAGKSGVTGDVPAGAIFGGWPARPFKEWAREVAAVQRLGSRKS